MSFIFSDTCFFLIAGYLHGYKTPKHFQTNPLRPTYSIFVPHSTVETDEDSFEIRSNQDKKMSMSNHYVFRAPTRAENQAWYESLSELSQKFQSPPLLESTENNFSNTPSHRDLPPLPANILPIEAQQRRAIEPAPEQDQTMRQIQPTEQVQSAPQQVQREEHLPVASPVQHSSPMRQQKENVPTPKQQYLKAYPAAERTDDLDLEHPPVPPKTPIDYKKSQLGRSDTISGDNQLANISAGGHASTNNYVANTESHHTGKYESTQPIVTNVYEGTHSTNQGDHYDGEYESTKPIKTNVYEGVDYSRKKHHDSSQGNEGEYESTKPIVTDVYEGVDYSRNKHHQHHHGAKQDYGEYESTKPITTDVYEGAQHKHNKHHHTKEDLGEYESTKPITTDVYEGTHNKHHHLGEYESTQPIQKNVYEGGKHTHGKHHHGSRDHLGKYESTKPIRTNIYDDDDDSSDEMDTAIYKHNHNLGKYAYTSSDREKYSLGGHTPLKEKTKGKHNEGYSYGKNFKSGGNGNDFDTSGRYTKSHEQYKPNMTDDFDDESFTLGRDEYSNNKGGLPGQ